MRKDTVFFAATTAFAAVVAFVLWSELQEKNRLIAGLQLVDARDGPQDEAPLLPASTAVAPLAGAGATGDASPPVAALHAAGCDQERLARARQSATTAVAQMATTLQLYPDEVQRVTRAREAELIARLPCASADGRNPDLHQLNQLQQQFLEALGPARVEQLLELNAERETKRTMALTGLPRHFADASMPLTDEQILQLTELIHDENMRMQRNKLRDIPFGPDALIRSMEQELKQSEDALGRLLTASQSFLDPEHLARWRELSLTGIEQTRSTIRMWRERAERGEEIPSYVPPTLSLVMAPSN